MKPSTLPSCRPKKITESHSRNRSSKNLCERSTSSLPAKKARYASKSGASASKSRRSARTIANSRNATSLTFSRRRRRYSPGLTVTPSGSVKPVNVLSAVPPGYVQNITLGALPMFPPMILW